ncbi:MAG: penicillin-binding protein 1A [Bdellovibrionales bacterium]
MRFWVNLLSFAMLALIVGILAVFAGFAYMSNDLPSTDRLATYEPPTLTRLHAGDGRFMMEYAAEKRLFVPIASMPPLVINAFLSAEDKDYYRHRGVDFISIARAMLTNLKSIGSGRRPIGASTITQQVARNFFLTNEVSYKRKIKEILLAFRLERTLSKERILELYLNQIFLGERSYGVAAASLNYFNKSLNELTVAEAAYLAALPKGPNNYHPVRNKTAAVERRNWVIGRMLEDGYVTAGEAQAAAAQDLVRAERSETRVDDADYFAEEVRRQLVEKFGDQAVLEGGLYVRTTVDPVLQAAAKKALQSGLEDFDRRRSGYHGPVGRITTFENWPQPLFTVNKPPGAEDWELAAVAGVSAKGIDIVTATRRGNIGAAQAGWVNGKLRKGDIVLVSYTGKEELFELHQVPQVQGALVALDPHTGRVLAMVGGFSSKISVFNRATQAQRQPGSAFKPFVYLAALDNGFTPSSLVLDAPFAYDQGPGLPLWRPENYSNEFYGPTPLRVGIEKSRNVMTVRLAHAVGMETVKQYAEKFGIVQNMPLLLSMALGSIETTPMQLTTAYAMIVNGGRRIMPGFIDIVQDRRGRVIWQHDPRRCSKCSDMVWQPPPRDMGGGVMAAPDLPDIREQVQDPRTAYQMTSILEGVVQRGTAAKLKSQLQFPVAGKTGTTNDAKDAWFVGFTPDLAVGVFVGYDDPRSLGDRETGSSVAAPIFGDFMQAAMKDKPAIPFRVPSGLRMVRVSAKTGALAEPGAPDAIWEAFLPETDPGTKPQGLLDGSVDGMLVNDPTVETSPYMQGMPEDGVTIMPEFQYPPPADVPPPQQPAVIDGLY